MGTPYECLERIAADVASLVPDAESVVRVHVEFDPKPCEVEIVSALYRPDKLWSETPSTRLTLPAEKLQRVRDALTEFFVHSQSWDDELERMSIMVAIDGSFSHGETLRKRSTAAKP